MHLQHIRCALSNKNIPHYLNSVKKFLHMCREVNRDDAGILRAAASAKIKELSLEVLRQWFSTKLSN